MPSSNRKLVVSGVAAALMIAAGWVGWKNLRPTEVPSPQAPAEGRPGVLEGQVAPDFSVPTLNGDTYRLSDHGGKPRIVFIMAYWCGTCIPEARALGRIKQEYGEQVSILSLDVDPSSTREALSQFKGAVGDPDYIWGFDTEQRVFQTYKVHSLDATIIIDAAGRVVYRDNAPTPYEQLNDVVAPLVEG